MIYTLLVYLVLIILDVIILILSLNKPKVSISRFFPFHIISLLIFKTISICYLIIPTRSVELVYSNFTFLFILVQPYIWLMLCLDYVKTREIIKQVITIIASIIAMAILYNYMMDNLYFSNIDNADQIREKNQILMIVAAVLYTGIGATCLILFLSTLFKSSRMQQKRLYVMIILFFLPWLTSFFGISLNIYEKISTDFMIIFVSCTTYFFKTFNDRIHFAVPIATETIFRRASDAVLLVDTSDIIIDANDAFLELYPEVYQKLNKIMRKTTMSCFLSTHKELNGLYDDNNILRYEITINGETRYFLANIDPIISEDDIRVGKLLMIKDITVFAENEMKLESKAENSEMSFLQAQIKPHFLNNTLNTIAALILRDPEKAQELIADLGEFLRNSYYFDSSSNTIFLGEELEILNTYVSIEKSRFLDRLSFEIVCDQVPQIYIPRLMIQPLVENAIAHGIFHKPHGGKVVLKITEGQEKVLFEVIDDGVGLAASRIEEIFSGKDEKQGIGILNIHNRLMKFYGEGLKIESVLGTGTTVSFSIPLIENAPEVNYGNHKVNHYR